MTGRCGWDCPSNPSHAATGVAAFPRTWRSGAATQYWNEKHAGEYSCVCCGTLLFSSETKYESGTGWPSFWAPLENAIGTSEDRSLFVTRTEVHCRRCGGHLGHVFEDGPPPTGLRYCMNGVAMTFTPDAGAGPA